MKLPPGHVAGQGVLKPSGYGGFGERMLKNMGWEKGQGLGLNADGIKEAIQVKKKEDTVGVSGRVVLLPSRERRFCFPLLPFSKRRCTAIVV